MAVNKKINMPLPSADDLFKTDAERQNDWSNLFYY